MSKNMEVGSAILGSAIWGLTFIFIKPLVGLAPAADVAFWRYFVSGCALLMFWFMKTGKFNFDIRDIKLLLITSALGVFLYQVLCNIGVTMINGSHAGIINGLVPVITVALERIVRKKKISSLKKLSLGLSLVGILFIAQSGSSAKATGFNWGYILTLTGVTLWVIYSFITESLLEKYKGVELIGYQSVIGALMVIPYNIITEQRIISFDIFYTSEGVINLLLAALLSAGIGYGLYIRGVEKLGVSTMAFLLNIMPISALIAGYFILGEAITINSIIGLGFILVSVYLVLMDSKKPKQIKQKKRKKLAIAN